MRSGDLDRIISLQSKTVSKDDWGESQHSWASFADVWAKLEEKGASEFVSGLAELSRRRVAFLIRWRDDVSELNRVEFEGDEFDITGVQEIGRRVGLRLLCEAIR